MVLATDVHYDEGGDCAIAAGVVFHNWSDAEVVAELSEETRGIAPYQSGAFYRRELPCLSPLIRRTQADFPIRIVVVDGFVNFTSGWGLGRHVYESFHSTGIHAVVGVAKNPFAAAEAVAVLRGGSRRPLYVGAHGVPLQVAASWIRSMHGQHRMPTHLRRVDRLARAMLARVCP